MKLGSMTKTKSINKKTLWETKMKAEPKTYKQEQEKKDYFHI